MGLTVRLFYQVPFSISRITNRNLTIYNVWTTGQMLPLEDCDMVKSYTTAAKWTLYCIACQLAEVSFLFIFYIWVQKKQESTFQDLLPHCLFKKMLCAAVSTQSLHHYQATCFHFSCFLLDIQTTNDHLHHLVHKSRIWSALLNAPEAPTVI